METLNSVRCVCGDFALLIIKDSQALIYVGVLDLAGTIPLTLKFDKMAKQLFCCMILMRCWPKMNTGTHQQLFCESYLIVHPQRPVLFVRQGVLPLAKFGRSSIRLKYVQQSEKLDILVYSAKMNLNEKYELVNLILR